MDLLSLWSCSCHSSVLRALQRFTSMGMIVEGGIGREMSSGVVVSAATVELFSIAWRAFTPSASTAPSGSRTELMNQTRMPALSYLLMTSPLLGGKMRKADPYDDLLEHGCFYQCRHDFESPGWYELPC